MEGSKLQYLKASLANIRTYITVAFCESFRGQVVFLVDLWGLVYLQKWPQIIRARNMRLYHSRADLRVSWGSIKLSSVSVWNQHEEVD